MSKIGILGAGVSGIALSYFLSDKHDVTILESSPKIGGLCSTKEVAGFRYDVGGHIAYSRYSDVNELVESLLGQDCLFRPMDTKEILYKGHYLKYPFHDSLADLPTDNEIYNCVSSYLSRNQDMSINTVEDWFLSTFGDYLSQHDRQYTAKLWKYPCYKMLPDWVARIPKPNQSRIIDSAFGMLPNEESKMFKYPRSSGFQTIVERMIGDQKIECNTGIEFIYKESDGWWVESEFRKKRFDNIVLTYSLKDAVKHLVNAYSEVPQKVLEAAAALKYNSLAVIFLGFNCVPHPKYLDTEAVYIASHAILPHRVCFPCYFSPSMAPEGKASLTAEVTYLPGEDIGSIPDQELIGRVIEDLTKTGIIKFRNEIEVKDVVKFKYAYPIYDLDYHKNMNIIQQYFISIGVHLLGRFAQWEYINSDECIHRAKQLAEILNREN